MKLLLWMFVHELRMQFRSYRFRILLVAYLVVTIAPAVALQLLETGFGRRYGPGLWAGVVESTLSVFTWVLGWVLAGDALTREHEENSFLVASLGASSNSAYVGARWMAVSMIVLVVSVIPLCVTAGIGAWGPAGMPAASYSFLQWLVVVVPLALMSTALSLGVSTIVGSAVGGTILALFGGIVSLAIIEGLMARVGRTMYGPADWLRVEMPLNFFAMMVNRWGGRRPDYSDATFDWRTWGELALPRGLIIMALALSAVVVASAFIRRTRPNHRVWPIRENHPIRTYLKAIRSIYERLTPDAGLQALEKLAISMAVLCVVSSFAFVLNSDRRWRELAEARASTERSGWPDPDGGGLAVARVSINGMIDAVSGLDVNVSMVLRNDGLASVDRMPAQLNPSLVLSADGSSGVTVERRWDRVELRFAEAIPAGGNRDVSLRVRGIPSDVRFAKYQEKEDFASWYEQVKASHTEFYIPDFSRSVRVRHVSVRGVDLKGVDLFPVPRHMPWDGEDQSVQIADIEVDLNVNGGLSLATSCGDLTSPGDGERSLRGGCRGELRTFSVVGGNWDVTELSDHASLACMPIHREFGVRKSRTLVDAIEAARARWPGLAGGERTVLAEVVDPQGFHGVNWVVARDSEVDREPTIEGAIVLVKEAWLMDRDEADGGALVIGLRAQDLLSRRPVTPNQNYFFRYFYGALASAELGYARKMGAVLGQTEHIGYGLLRNMTWEPVWTTRLPAVVEDLRNRVGAVVLRDAVEEFLSTQSSAPGRASELFDIIERRSGVSLERFYWELVVAGSVPRLDLDEVSFVRQGSGWDVDGIVRNSGDGQSLIEVVLRTEVSTLKTTLTVEPRDEQHFRFETPYRPIRVELDPDRKSFRWEPRTTRREVVNKAGGS